MTEKPIELSAEIDHAAQDATMKNIGAMTRGV